MNKYLSIMILVGILATPFTGVQAKTKDLENLFYYFPSERAYASVEKNYRDIDILAPQIYILDADFGLSLPFDTKILDFADKKRMDVMPLVVNPNSDKALMTALLADEDAQADFIDDLLREAKKRDYIGWQFDFENLNHLDRDRYTDFVAMAYKEFKKKKLILSVAVIPRTTPYDPKSTNQDWSSPYDVENLADHADFISLMAYDDPKSTGPVASMDYVKKVLDYNLNYIPNEKVSLGIPFYCWQYVYPNQKKVASIPYHIAAGTQEKYKNSGVASLYLKGDIQAEVFLFVKPDGINLAWCDNVQSFKAKRSLADDHDLRGISAWALGQEDERIWKEL